MSTWPGICWLLVRQHGYWTGRRPAKPGAQSHCMCLSCSHSPSLQHPQHSWSTPTPPAGAHPSCNATGTASSWCCCSHLQAHIHNTQTKNEKWVLCVSSLVAWERCLRYFRCWSHNKQQQKNYHHCWSEWVLIYHLFRLPVLLTRWTWPSQAYSQYRRKKNVFFLAPEAAPHLPSLGFDIHQCSQSVKPLYRFDMSLVVFFPLAHMDFTKRTLLKSRIKYEQSTDHMLHFSYS